MANAILNSSLTGDADFAGAVFGTSEQQEPTTPVETTQQEVQNDVPRGTNDNEKTPTQEAPEEEKKVAKVREPDKKSKATKDQVEATLKKATTKSSDSSEQDTSDSSDNDLPKNPHFDDRPVLEKPEGDDSEKGISSWKEIKSEMKKAREERDRLKAELEATKEKVVKVEGGEVDYLRQEVDSYKTRLAELSRELKAANFERSPEYVESVKKPLAGIQGDLKAIADANDADFSKLWQAITEPDMRKRTDSLEDLIGDFKRMEQLEVVKLTEKFHNLREYHERFSNESESMAEQLRARKAQEEQEFIENDQRLQKAFTANAWTRMEDRYDFLKEIDGQSDWNSSIRSARQAASETNLDRLPVEDRSTILARAAVVPFLESAINHYSNKLQSVTSEKDAKIAELQHQLKSAIGATPSLGSSSSDSSDDDDDTEDMGSVNFGASIMGRR
jgi:hypothetical protein